MKKFISLLLLLTLSLSLFSCDGLPGKQDSISETTTFEEQQTAPDETTDAPDAPVTPDSVGFQTVSITDQSYTVRAIISSKNDNAYINLESFFNQVLAPSLFPGATYDVTLADVDWFVDDKPADANTKVFGGSIVVFKAKEMSQPPQQPEDGTIKIVFYHTMSATNLQPVLEDAIDRFNDIYPNITIEHQQVGDYDSLFHHIKTDIIVGAQPNIAYCYGDHVAFYNNVKVVQPLDELIASTNTVIRADATSEQIGLTQAQIDNFIDGFYNEGRQFGDGKMYTLPLSKSTEVLYYNIEFFKEHTLQVPTTWDEMEAVCRQIKEIDPTSIPLGYDSEANWFITMCEQYKSPYTSATGDHFLFDNEANWNFVEKFAKWYADGLVTTKELSGGYTSDIFKKANGEPGKCYMSIGSSAGATHQAPDLVNGKAPFTVGIAPIPQIDKNAPKVISQGPSLCIFKNANEEEVLASWLFVKFLTTDAKFQTEFSMASGYFPVIESAQDDEVYKDFLQEASGTKTGIQALSALQCLNQANAYFSSPAFVGSAKARDEVGLLMQVCFAGYETAGDKKAMIQEAFDIAIEECNY